jgi:hypothetical protein
VARRNGAGEIRRCLAAPLSESTPNLRGPAGLGPTRARIGRGQAAGNGQAQGRHPGRLSGNEEHFNTGSAVRLWNQACVKGGSDLQISNLPAGIGSRRLPPTPFDPARTTVRPPRPQGERERVGRTPTANHAERDSADARQDGAWEDAFSQPTPRRHARPARQPSSPSHEVRAQVGSSCTPAAVRAPRLQRAAPSLRRCEANRVLISMRGCVWSRKSVFSLEALRSMPHTMAS